MQLGRVIRPTSSGRSERWAISTFTATNTKAFVVYANIIEINEL